MIKFLCDICLGEIIFNDEDEIIKNTCVCEDNPVKGVDIEKGGKKMIKKGVVRLE